MYNVEMLLKLVKAYRTRLFIKCFYNITYEEILILLLIGILCNQFKLINNNILGNKSAIIIYHGKFRSNQYSYTNM